MNIMCLLLVFTLFYSAFSKEQWFPMEQFPGTDGSVSTVLAIGDGKCYIGGQFTVAGGIESRGVAYWDGTMWKDLGGGVNGGEVKAIAKDRKGNIYIGGTFQSAGGIIANNIAVWNGATWKNLGAGLSGTSSGMYPWVSSLAIDSNNNVYAGGNFTISSTDSIRNLAFWNGEKWHTVGKGIRGDNSHISALSVDNTNKIWVGGRFSFVDDRPANGFASWDGSKWQIPSLEFGGIQTIACGNSGEVYVGGSLGFAVSKVAVWNGSWKCLLWTKGTPSRIRFDSINDELLVGGNLYEAQLIDTLCSNSRITTPKQIKYLAKIKNNVLSDYLTSNTVGNFRDFDLDNNGNVFFAGLYAGVVATGWLSKYNSGVWSTLGKAPNQPVKKIKNINNKLYIAGGFSTFNGKESFGFAELEGSKKTYLSTSIKNPHVTGFTLTENDIYIVGSFKLGVQNHNILKWSNGDWNWFDSIPNGNIADIVADSQGNIYIVGSFSKIGELTVGNCAKWSPAAGWEAIGYLPNSKKIVLSPKNIIYAISDDIYMLGNRTWDKMNVTGMYNSIGVSDICFDDFGNIIAALYLPQTGSFVIRQRENLWDTISPLSGGQNLQVAYSNGNVFAAPFKKSFINRILKIRSNAEYSISKFGVTKPVWAGGDINCIAVKNDTVYIGGDFTIVASEGVDQTSKKDLILHQPSTYNAKLTFNEPVTTVESSAFSQHPRMASFNLISNSLRINANQDFPAQILLVDLRGRRCISKNIHLKPGSNTFNLIAFNIPPGAYLLLVKYASQNLYTKRFLLCK